MALGASPRGPGVSLRYVNTKDQVADIFTKAGVPAAQWEHLLMRAGICLLMTDLVGGQKSVTPVIGFKGERLRIREFLGDPFPMVSRKRESDPKVPQKSKSYSARSHVN